MKFSWNAFLEKKKRMTKNLMVGDYEPDRVAVKHSFVVEYVAINEIASYPKEAERV
jgi:hypothetical protein